MQMQSINQRQILADAFAVNLRALRAHNSRLVRRYYGWLDWASRAEVARDTLQDAIAAALECAHLYDPSRPPLPWLYHITHYAVMRSARAHLVLRSRVVHHAWVDILEGPRPDELEAAHLLREFLRGRLARLTPGEQRLIEARFVEELTGREMAQVTGVAQGATRVRLHRALQKLRAPGDEPQPARGSAW